jgi:hypothetical protein
MHFEVRSPMNQRTPALSDIVVQIRVVADKLKDTSSEADRRHLLKQFRLLLDDADKIIAQEQSLK